MNNMKNYLKLSKTALYRLVLLATHFVFYPVGIITLLYVIFFSLTSIMSSNIIRPQLSK